MKKLVVVLSTLIIGVCVVTGCDSPAVGASPGPTALGESVTVTVAEETVAAVDMTPVGGAEASFGQALDFGGLIIRVETPTEDTSATPTPGNRPWAALVTIQNNRPAEVMYNPLDFHFLVAGGNVYEAMGASMLAMMSPGILSPGAQVEAYIVMELPSDSPPAGILYEPYLPSDEKWVGIWQ